MTTTPIKFAARINQRVLPETTSPNKTFEYIDIGAVASDGTVARPAELVAFAGAPSRARRLARPGSTIISTVRTYLRAIAYVDNTLATAGVFSTGFAILEPRPQFDARFFHYSCRSEPFVEEIVARSVGVSYPAIAPSDLGDLVVPTPSVETQRRVANFLDDRISRIDGVIRERELQVAALLERRLAMARDLTTRGTESVLRPTGVYWMPTTAHGWALPKIATVFRTGSGTTPSSDNPAFYDGDTPWVNTGDVQDRPISSTTKHVTRAALAQHSTLKVYAPGSLIIAMYGQGATKGRVGILNISACVNQACCVLTPRDDVTTEWAFHWFQAQKQQIVQLAVGSGQPNLNQDIIRSLRIPVPPKEEQSRLAQILTDQHRCVDALVHEMTDQVTLLQARKRSLITAAVMGEFDVNTATGRGI